jgi:transporter family protein
MNWSSWAILSAIFAGATAVLAKAGVKNVDSNLAMAIRTTVVLVMSWAVAAVLNRQPIASLTSKNWLFLVLSAVATGLSWICYFKALQLGKASQVAPVDKLSVVVAMALGVLFLGESLTLTHWLGGAFIVVGAVLLIGA